MSTAFPKLAYSIVEACKATSLGRTTIYGYIASGRLKATSVGGRTIIFAEDLRDFLESWKPKTEQA